MLRRALYMSSGSTSGASGTPCIRLLLAAGFKQCGVSGLQQPIEPLAGDGRKQQHVAAGCGGQLLLHFGGAGQLGFADGHDLRPLGQAVAVLLELAADRAVVLDRVGAVDRLRLDQVHEDARALDVPQEFVPQAGAGVGAFDQARDVGHHERAVHVDLHDAQVGSLRGERIVGDFGPGARHAAQERALAGVRFADQADVGDHFQLEREPPRFAFVAAACARAAPDWWPT